MAYSPITTPEITNGAIITQTLMTKLRDNLQAICDDDTTIPLANTLKRMGRQNRILVGASPIDDGASALQVQGNISLRSNVPFASESRVIVGDSGTPYGDFGRPPSSGDIEVRRLGVVAWRTNGTISYSPLPTVVGTDPGGSELLRVGGAFRSQSVKIGGSTGSFPWLLEASGGADEFYIRSVTAGVVRLSINASGAVIIGTDPGGPELLRVGGGVTATYFKSSAATGLMLLSSTAASDATTSAYISFQRNGSEKGWVGFGDALSGIFGIANAVGPIRINGLGGAYVGPTDPGGSELLRVGGAAKASGNLEAGSAVSNGKIIARAVDSSSPQFVLGNAAGVNHWAAYETLVVGAQGSFKIADVAAGYVDRLTINTAGHVFIGTDPGGSELLRVGGAIRADTITATAGVVVTGGPTDGNAAMEFGRVDGVSSTPYIDFHTSTVAVDYNVRLIASGAAAGAGGGTLRIDAANAIVGTDPGGTELLRVGGAVKTTGDISIKVPMTWPAVNAVGVLQNSGAGALSWATLGAGGTTSGTFTPLLKGTSGGFAHTYGAFNRGRYWLTGKIVFYTISLEITTKDTTMAGTVIVEGIPFAPISTDNFLAEVSPQGVAITGHAGVYGNIGGTQGVYLNKYTAGGSIASVTSADIQPTSIQIGITGHYVIP